MVEKIKIIGLNGIPLIKPGDRIPKIILDALTRNDIGLENGDILVIAQTIISKANNRLVDLKKIAPTEEACRITEELNSKARLKGLPEKSPELIQKILDEAKEIIKKEHVIVVETNHGFVCANAGIDKSNVEGETTISLLPEDCDEEARSIAEELKKVTKKDVGVIISDSFGRPFRIGATGVALGTAGVSAILDKRGKTDLFGHELQTTLIGQVDNLSSAAQLLMG
ncbi:MAG: coenzyme F420-0:L-glutamate ligase, partial [Promethearchaeota archaeon]